MVTRTVFCPKFDVDFVDDESKIEMHICNQNVTRLLCDSGTFLLSDHEHHNIIDDIEIRDRN